MPKSLKIKFRDKLNYINFYEAYLRTCRHKKLKKEILQFEIDLETNLTDILYEIKEGRYHPGDYHSFIIHEPKRREILALPFRDRIVLQWYVTEFLKPYIVPRLINDTYACLENRGTHNAVDKLQHYMRVMKRNYGKYYVLKCDIHHFFYSIDLAVLYDIMCRFIKDPELKEFTKLIIYEHKTAKKGIPIGNYTSQYFANIYLNELDQFIKRELHVKYYVRYMDDFILLLPTKEEAKKNYIKIEEFLKEYLHLELNPKSCYFPNTRGVDFCGYRVFETHRLLRKRSIVKINRRIKYWNKWSKEESFDGHKVLLCWNAFLGHSSHANCYHLQKKMFSKLSFVDNFPNENFIPTSFERE